MRGDPGHQGGRAGAAHVGRPHRLRGAHGHGRGVQPGPGRAGEHRRRLRHRRHRAQRDPGGPHRRRDPHHRRRHQSRQGSRWPASSAPPSSSTRRPRACRRLKNMDYTFECVGHPAVIRNAIDALAWGGTCVILGVPPLGTEAAFDVSGALPEQVDHGLPLRRRPAPQRHPRARRPLPRRSAQARRAGQPHLPSSSSSTRRWPTCTPATWPGASSRFDLASGSTSPTSTSASPTGAGGATTTRSARSTSSTTPPCGGASTACAPGSASPSASPSTTRARSSGSSRVGSTRCAP